MSAIAFTPEGLKDAVRQFRGVIIAAEYGMTPFGFEGAAGIKTKRPQIAVQIETPEYDKPQYEWFPPTNVRKTKWAYFIEAMTKCGAMKDVVISGATDEERLRSFAESLVGMEFDWTQYGELEIVVKGKTVECLLPDKYYGKKEIGALEEIREEKIEL